MKSPLRSLSVSTKTKDSPVSQSQVCCEPFQFQFVHLACSLTYPFINAYLAYLCRKEKKKETLVINNWFPPRAPVAPL